MHCTRAGRALGAAVVTVVLALLTLCIPFAFSGPAGASPVADKHAASVYPPPSCPTLSGDRSVLDAGQTLTLTGAGFVPDSVITIVMRPGETVLGHVTSDDKGGFSVTVLIPAGTVGKFLIYAIGGGVTGCPADPSVPVQIAAGAASSSGGAGVGGQSAGGSTASTGVDIAAGVILGAALLGAGVLLLRGGRRTSRRPSRAHH